MKDHSSAVRVAVASALGQLGNAEALTALSDTWKDADVDVRKAAQEAMKAIEKKQQTR